MRLTRRCSGFALALTLTLMTLIAIVVVAYLSSTRTERNTTSIYASRMRAQTIADSGLSAAMHVLQANTRYGNYITAMPAPSPSPSSIVTEIYRPTNPATGAVIADDYLRFDNAGGELLVSLASPPPSGSTPQVDVRPSPSMVYTSPTPTPLSTFQLPSPNPALAEEQLPPLVSPTPVGNSYNFNQIVRIGTNNNARLVQPSPSPSPLPALGQWVSVRNTAGDLVGRYAFYMEDESMKVNVNVAGNASSSRTNDLTVGATATNQIQEIDPGSILPLGSPAPNRLTANSNLAALGASGGRLFSRSTLGLVNEWSSTFPDYAHLTTVLSKDDNTTAKGWQRLDLNALVASASTNTDRVNIANRIANWIRDAWTGPGAGPTPITSLSATQMFNDDRLRKQIAANIVDYISTSALPTDMGDVNPNPSASPSPAAIPVIGIKKIPYIHNLEAIYQASGTTPVPGTSAGSHQTTIKMKLRFRFINLFDTDLTVSDQIGSIQVTGVPPVTKNGGTLIDVSGQTFTVNVSQLRAITGSGLLVAKGLDGTSTSGARTFETDWLVTQAATFSVPTSGDKRPQIGQKTMTVTMLDTGGGRLDKFSIPVGTQTTGYAYVNTSGANYSSQGDFVEDTNNPDGSARVPSPQIASINRTAKIAGSPAPTTGQIAGDPRYRGPAGTATLSATLSDRWDNDGSRTDATCNPSGSPCPWLAKAYKINRVEEYVDKAELNPRGPAVDWFDSTSDRPLAFIRSGPMLNIGELGNVSTGEYPWRTVYLQHSERPPNVTTVFADVTARRSQSLDYVLLDLFRAGGTITRSGALNINTQLQYLSSTASIPSIPDEALFVGVPVGLPTAAPTPQTLTQAPPGAGASPSPADRLSAGINLLVSSNTNPSGSGTTPLSYRVASVANKRVPLATETATADNQPTRPYFQIGELAPTLSRLLSASQASDVAGTSTSQVVYSALRDDPTGTVTANYHKDFEVEQAFREVSSSITTRGNVFRILYVGQAIKDMDHAKDSNGNPIVDNQREILAEYLGEAFVERQAIWGPADPILDPNNSDIVRTTDSAYRIIANRVITE